MPSWWIMIEVEVCMPTDMLVDSIKFALLWHSENQSFSALLNLHMKHLWLIGWRLALSLSACIDELWSWLKYASRWPCWLSVSILSRCDTLRTKVALHPLMVPSVFHMHIYVTIPSLKFARGCHLLYRYRARVVVRFLSSLWYTFL